MTENAPVIANYHPNGRYSINIINGVNQQQYYNFLQQSSTIATHTIQAVCTNSQEDVRPKIEEGVPTTMPPARCTACAHTKHLSMHSPVARGCQSV